MPAPTMSIEPKLTARVRLDRTRNGISACVDRDSITRNSPISTRPVTMVATVTPLPHDVDAAWVRP